MISAGRLGRAKDAFDKRDTLRRYQAAKIAREAAPADLATARGNLRAMVEAVHAAPSHLAPKLFPLIMQAESLYLRLCAERAAMFARIDQVRAS